MFVGSRPDSRASQLSGSIWSMHENLLEPTEPGRSSPFARDSTKLALWAKAKGVQEQVGGDLSLYGMLCSKHLRENLSLWLLFAISDLSELKVVSWG